MVRMADWLLWSSERSSACAHCCQHDNRSADPVELSAALLLPDQHVYAILVPRRCKRFCAPTFHAIHWPVAICPRRGSLYLDLEFRFKPNMPCPSKRIVDA